jgi:hypothetical protein
LINYTISSPERRQASNTKQTKIIANNNEDKNETEKKMRGMNRKIEDLKTETLIQFDYSSSEFIKFKNLMGITLERQDKSILSILTRVTFLECRIDSLEIGKLKVKNINTGTIKERANAEKHQLLESLQIAEKLSEDFKKMRKEVFNKIFELQEKDLKIKANIQDIREVESRFDEKFFKYETDTKIFKDDLRYNIKQLQNRMSKQIIMPRARSPVPDMDSSAILSKRYMDCSK